MKTLVIYFSLTGNTKLIAETIAKELNADIESLTPIRPIEPKGFKKYLIAGKQVIFKEKPAIKELSKNPEEYDLIILGSPIWAGSYASYLKTFFSECSLKDKKTAVFCCHAGGESGKFFSNMKRELKSCKIIGEEEFRDPVKKHTDMAITKTKEWCIKVINNYSNQL